MIKSKLCNLTPIIEYPCLMKDEHRVVLFTDNCTGTFLWSDEVGLIGKWSEQFIIADYEPFTGSVTLSNNGE
jgi:hypothetical protein